MSPFVVIDRLSIHHPLPLPSRSSDRGFSYFAVFDGHNGEWAAEYLTHHLQNVIAKECVSSTTNEKTLEECITSAFVQTDSQLLAAQKNSSSSNSSSSQTSSSHPSSDASGSTSCVILVNASHIFCANNGDSRAILCRSGTAVELSSDHKPSLNEEKQRIERAGGRVSACGNYVEYGENMLGVSRAFGDPLFKNNNNKPSHEQPVIVHPHIGRIKRDIMSDEFLILASDGLWNHVSHQAACDFVRKRFLLNKDAEDIAHKLTQFALDKKSQDNVTVVIVQFPIAFDAILLQSVQISGQNGSASTPASTVSSTVNTPHASISHTRAVSTLAGVNFAALASAAAGGGSQSFDTIAERREEEDSKST